MNQAKAARNSAKRDGRPTHNQIELRLASQSKDVIHNISRGAREGAFVVYDTVFNCAQSCRLPGHTIAREFVQN